MITVVTVDLTVDSSAFVPLLSPSELARAEGMATEGLRRRYVVAHGSLRQRLASVLGDDDPASIPIEVGEHGKPFVVDGPEFNLSDSGDLALIAISDGPPVGIDVERVREVEHERLARRFFSVLECAALESCPDPAVAFFTIWTRKEAVVKATGRGISGGLSAFTVSLGADAHSASGCWVEPVAVPQGYVAAVATVETE